MDDAMEALETTIGLVVAELGGMPARVSRDLDLRRRIERDIFDLRQRVTDKLAEMIKKLQDGSPRLQQ
jgi:hypothetical protein